MRLDNQQVWYFGNKSVEISNTPYTASSATSQGLSISGKTLAWVDSRTIKVSEGASVYYLSRDGGDALSFSGSIVSNVASRGVAGGVAGIAIIVHNINNDEDMHTVVTGLDGSFTVPGAIPGSTYAVTTDESTIETQVEPVNDGEDVGVVTLTDGSYGFKALPGPTPTYPAYSPFLFADGTQYAASIRIRNDGTLLSPSPFYTLTVPPGMTIASSLMNNLQTIPAGGERDFYVSFSVASIAEEWKDFIIGVRLEDSSGKVWEDTVSFRFYRDALTLRFTSNGMNYPTVITPNARVIRSGGGDLRVPFSTTGYKVVISGATMDTEMKYSIGIETPTGNISNFVNPNAHEPNNGADSASTLGMGQVVVSYLAFNDLDYWNIDTSFPKQTRLLGGSTWEAAPSFAWEPLPGTTSAYALEVSSDSSFVSLHEAASLGAGEVEYNLITPLPTEGTWYWRLRAQVDGFWGTWNTRILEYSRISKTATGGNHTLILQVKGDVHATGYNLDGEFGNGTRTGFSSPIPVMTGVEAMAAGNNHTLYLKTDGYVWATGANSSGQLGDNTTTSRIIPNQVIADVQAIAAGQFYSMFIKTDGSVWATGQNDYGQLGDGTTINRYAPVQVMSGVQSVVAGGNSTLFLKTDGTAWAAGYNSYGQLGDGTTTNHYSPVQVLESVQRMAIGRIHTMFLKSDGTVWATGNNAVGQFGNGTTTTFDTLTPVQVMSGVADIVAAENHTLFLKTDGSVWATGQNDYGQLGDGTTSNRSTPVQVMSSVQSVAAGGSSTFFLKSDGTMWATGYNVSGQLGDGTNSNRSTPVQIRN